MGSRDTSVLTNYIAYVDPEIGVSRIGHLDLKQETIQPLSFVSGTPITNLYEVIEAGRSNITSSGSTIPSRSVKRLAPISGRDVLAVGKNYLDHAKEFNSSGYDSSDKVDLPSHPVIFTKRSTSIIADGEEIFPHKGFTETLDYEGEIGVIVGKPGFQISEANALEHVWGFTTINDMTARERQKDHKQFYVGKSPDTFCPMGPIAVPKEDLPLNLRIQTHVNGELRQDATLESLIFSIPTLIHEMSAGQTLQLGDVLATGTPAGVGIGKKPPVFLRPGDEISVSVTGLSTLRNKISTTSTVNPMVSQIESHSVLQTTNAAKSLNGKVGLTEINSKFLNYNSSGSGSDNVIFVHGLGGTQEYYTPLISALSLTKSHSLHLFDLEGHGLSPTHPLSVLSIKSFATDISGIFENTTISSATLVAHSMGCLAAIKFTLDHPELVKKLVLIGPPPSPLPEAARTATQARASLARTKGMIAVVDSVVAAGTSENTKKKNLVAVAAVRQSLLGQDPEGYAKACSALAGATEALDLETLEVDTLIVTGDEDKVSPPALCEGYAKRIPKARVVVLPQCGHWHGYESLEGLTDAIRAFLRD